jgi:hypothetical protein
MSHNLYTINNEGGDVVSYHGASLGILYLGRGSTQNYPATLTTGDLFEWYDSNPINTLGATLRTGSATDWYDQITLPAGTYRFMNYVSAPVLDPTGIYRLRLAENGTVNNYGVIKLTGANTSNEDPYNFPYDLDFTNTYTSSVNITFVCDPTGTASIATGATTRQRISESQFLYIRRLA